MPASNKGRKFPPVEGVCTPKDIAAMLKKCSRKYATGRRNRAIIVFLYRCGLRVSELLSLTPQDVDGKAKRLRVLHGKGDKSRVVAMDAMAVDHLIDWLEMRFNGSATSPLFCTLEGKPLVAVYVRNMLRRVARKAGVTHRVHPHGLRHTHASELAAENVPLHQIRDQLGHANIATTDHYIQRLNPQARIDLIGAREFRHA